MWSTPQILITTWPTKSCNTQQLELLRRTHHLIWFLFSYCASTILLKRFYTKITTLEEKMIQFLRICNEEENSFFFLFLYLIKLSLLVEIDNHDPCHKCSGEIWLRKDVRCKSTMILVGKPIASCWLSQALELVNMFVVEMDVTRRQR